MMHSDLTGTQTSPLGIRALSSRAIASLPALDKHVMVEDIFLAALWPSTATVV